MHTIKLKLGKRSYQIVVGNGIIKHLGKYLAGLAIGRDAYIITNAPIKKRYGFRLKRPLESAGFKVRFKTIPDAETSKSLKIFSSVIQDLAQYDKKRQVFIIAFGGGVIGDLAGFVASIYKRGIAYVQVPTTLLAQIDSSIGGKTAVNLSEGKNLAGAFYQPRLVLSDVGLLNSLSKTQARAGLSEAIKYGSIKDARLFSYLERNYRDILGFNKNALLHVVKTCSAIKAGIVEQDEREEKGLRAILNFGHTIGHAIEAASNFKAYNHGEAVALGILIACDIAKLLGLMNYPEASRIESLIKRAGLPVKIKNVPLNKIINAHYRDKKFVGKTNKFVLLKGIGRARIVKNVPLGIIREAIKGRIQG